MDWNKSAGSGMINWPAVFHSKGYKHSGSDYSLFCKRKGSSLVFVAIYVNDIILTGTAASQINSLKSFFYDHFNIKGFRETTLHLGARNIVQTWWCSYFREKVYFWSFKRVWCFELLGHHFTTWLHWKVEGYKWKVIFRSYILQKVSWQTKFSHKHKFWHSLQCTTP